MPLFCRALQKPNANGAEQLMIADPSLLAYLPRQLIEPFCAMVTEAQKHEKEEKSADAKLVEKVCNFMHNVITLGNDTEQSCETRDGCTRVIAFMEKEKTVSIVLKTTENITKGSAMTVDYGETYWQPPYDHMPATKPQRLVCNDDRCRLVKDTFKGLCVQAKKDIPKNSTFTYSLKGRYLRESDITEDNDNSFSIGGCKQNKMVYFPDHLSLSTACMCEDYRKIVVGPNGKIMSVEEKGRRPNYAFVVLISVAAVLKFLEIQQ